MWNLQNITWRHAGFWFPNILIQMLSIERHQQNKQAVYGEALQGWMVLTPKGRAPDVLLSSAPSHILSFKTLPMLRLLSSKAQGFKKFWKTYKPCHVGFHWIALPEYSRMSTHMHHAFQSFCQLLASAKLAISSKVTNFQQPKCQNLTIEWQFSSNEEHVFLNYSNNPVVGSSISTWRESWGPSELVKLKMLFRLALPFLNFQGEMLLTRFPWAW